MHKFMSIEYEPSSFCSAPGLRTAPTGTAVSLRGTLLGRRCVFLCSVHGAGCECEVLGVVVEIVENGLRDEGACLGI